MVRSGLISQQGGASPVSPESFAARQKSTVPLSPYGFYEYLPEGYEQASSESVPLIIFLHGSDERGNGNSELNRVLTWGIPKQQNAGTWHHNFIGLSPQWLGATDDNYYAPEDLKDFISYAKGTYKVDPNRIYLTGVSAGTWLLMYYLQNYPTDHEVAASVILSGNAYVDYTDPALIAAANSPIWMMSNISDPLVPWSTNSLPNISVINTRNGINAVTTGMVEKLTGFVNSTHTGTWDGIYDSSLIGTASGSYDQFDEPVYDWMMGHTLAVNFNVGTGSGQQLVVDGNDTGAAWFPLRPNYRFSINAGTYQNIRFKNISVDTGVVQLSCNGAVTLTGEGFIIGGTAKNIDADFGYQMTCNGDGSAVTIDEDMLGGYENVRVSGINITDVGPGQSLLKHRPPNYNNGAGPISSTNVVIENWNINLPGSLYLDGIFLGGSVWNNAAYSTRNINPIIRNITIRGNFECQYPVVILNGEEALISTIDIEDVNTQVTANLHCRLTYLVGQGTIEKVSAKNHMGNAACIWGFHRTGNNPLSIVRNIVAQNSNRYSAVEIQGFSAYNVPGQGANTDYFIGGITADTLDTENDFSGCAADVYSLFGGTAVIKDVVSINGHSNTSGGNSAVNNMAGGSATISGDSVYANTTAAGVNGDLVPQSGSPLIGAGVSDANLVDDFFGKTRPSPPSIGAVEPE